MLTIYFNTGCAEKPAHEWKRWVDASLPASERDRYAFVGFSFYEEDCVIAPPSWKHAFDALGRRFPKSTLGFAEVGAEKRENKIPTMRRYYRMSATPPHDRFVGGYFWWQFSEDALEPALLQALAQSMAMEPKR